MSIETCICTNFAAKPERRCHGPANPNAAGSAGHAGLSSAMVPCGPQASIGLIETYFVAKLGLDALAGIALVFPMFMLLQMVSAGAMGGGILSAIARALGAGQSD